MNELRMKIIWAVALLLVSIGGTACANDGSASSHRATLDKEVPRLPSGATIEEVEQVIGPPRSQAELEDGEVSLYYGPWQLVFDPDLEVRIRSFKAGYWPSGRSFAALDKDVKKLVGSVRHTVEQAPGKPEAWEIKEFKHRENLWYGNGRWKLVFRDGKLAAKVRTSQVTEASG